jgi:hypothetical protein
VNNENICTSCGHTGYIQEVNMVVSKRHYGFVVGCVKASFLDVSPGDSIRCSSGFDVCETEEPEFASVRESIENVCVVIEDGRKARGTTGSRLGGPGFFGRIVDVYVVGIGIVTV